MEGPLLDDELLEKEDNPIGLFSPKILAVGAGLLCMGLLFKVQHWPGNALLILVGSGLVSGHAFYRAIILKNTLVERSMRALIPLSAVWVIFFWLQYTLIAFWFFLGAAVFGAAIDYLRLKRR